MTGIRRIGRKRWPPVLGGLTLLVMAAASAWPAVVMANAQAQATRARNAAIALEQAATTVQTQEELRRGYDPQQPGEVFAALAAPAGAGTANLGQWRMLAPRSELAGIDQLLAEYTTYAELANRYVQAANEGDYDGAVAAALNSEARARELGLALTQAAGRQRDQSQVRIPERAINLMKAVAAAAAAAGLGCLCYAGLTAIRRHGPPLVIDPLTQLPGHAGFHQLLSGEATRCAARGMPLSAVLLDIDEFHQLNQAAGHEAGDRLLARFAAELRAAPTGGRTFRLGGDEFGLVLSGCGAQPARITVERLRLALKGRLPDLRFSAGIATLGRDGGDAALLAAQATAALAEAKRQGKHQIVAYEDVPAAPAQIIPLAKSEGLRRLLAERGVIPVFQPILATSPARVLAFEALSRPDPRYGLAHAGEMFEIAERLGLTTELDEICRAAIFERVSALPPDIMLFVNVSPRVLDRSLLNPIAFTRTVTAAGLRPDRVVIEVTERAVDRLPVLLREAQSLRDHGFKLALDDVGAGNSGLEMLRRLPVDFVKIDREVVAGTLTNLTARAVFAAITAFARESRCTIVAEGIETAEVLDYALRSGADAVQGYLLGLPAPTFSQPGDEAFHSLRRRTTPAAVYAGLRQAG